MSDQGGEDSGVSVNDRLHGNSVYTEEAGDAVCELLEEGVSLRAICEQDGMPSRSTVMRWLDAHPGFDAKYARARVRQAEVHADAVVHIADTEKDPVRARVMIEARKWYAEKLKPKMYGNRQEVEHTGNVTMVMQPLDDKI